MPREVDIHQDGQLLHRAKRMPTLFDSLFAHVLVRRREPEVLTTLVINGETSEGSSFYVWLPGASAPGDTVNPPPVKPIDCW